MGPQPSLWPPFAARWGDAAAAAAPEPRGSGGDFPFPVPETPKCLCSAQENEEPCALSLFDPHLYLFISFFLSFFLSCTNPCSVHGKRWCTGRLEVAWVLCCSSCTQFGWELCNLCLRHRHLSPSYRTWMRSSEYPQAHVNSSPHMGNTAHRY